MIKVLFSILLILSAYQVHSQTLRVATDPSSPPFDYLENGEVVGFDVDFFDAVTKAGGYQFVYVQASWTDLFAEVLNGTVDLAVSGITINDARKEIYDFSVPYFLSTHVILAPEGTDITNAQDLIDKNVAVRNGTTGSFAVEDILGENSPNIQRYTTTDEAFQALTNGSADAYVDDSGILESLANNNAGFVVITDPGAFTKEFYGFMFPKGSTLVAGFNSAITTVLQNGEYSQIYTDWFGSTPDVPLLLAAGEDDDPYDVFNEEGLFGEEEVPFSELGEITILL